MTRPMMIFLLLIISIACSHNKQEKPKYSPVVSFQEEGKNFEAKMLLPKKFKEKIPVVIVVHEWWGRTPYIEKRAQMITEEGYAALPVDLFGNNKTVDNPKAAQELANPFYKNPELGVERLEKYIELAKKDPHVDPEQVYVIGFCFGGTQALNLARTGKELAGVVSFHGGLASTYPTANEIKTEILVLNGAADPMVPKEDLEAFEEEMESSGADLRIINYPGATHAFTNPNATAIGKKYGIPIAYNEKAAEAAWKEFLEFLSK
jgi:dienelactone hydrolase